MTGRGPLSGTTVIELGTAITTPHVAGLGRRRGDGRIAELVDLGGRTAVVTGAGRGIGRTIATRLAEAGARVTVADVDQAIAKATAAEIEGATALRVDAYDSESVAALADEVHEADGRLDIWVNNAGVYPFDFVDEIDDPTWNRVVDLNLGGTFRGCREAARVIGAAGNGGRHRERGLDHRLQVLPGHDPLRGLEGRRPGAYQEPTRHPCSSTPACDPRTW